MQIAVKASDAQKQEFLSKGIPAGIHINWLGEEQELASFEEDAYFDLLFNNEFLYSDEFIRQKTVFVNAVSCTAKETGRPNYIRINAWSGFLKRNIVEVAGGDDTMRKLAETILNALGWRHVWVPDEPGMIAARILCMIVNEAYFALGEGISTKGEIDLAMKLGTNYPHGPFEWAQKIGIEKIFYLLKKLQRQNAARYQPAPLLEEEVIKNGFIIKH